MNSKITIDELHESGFFTVLCQCHGLPIRVGRKVSVGCDKCVAERKERSKNALELAISAQAKGVKP